MMIRIISEIVAKYTVPVLLDRRIQSKLIELGPNKLYSVRLLYNSDVEIGGGIRKGIVGDKNEHPDGYEILIFCRVYFRISDQLQV